MLINIAIAVAFLGVGLTGVIVLFGTRKLERARVASRAWRAAADLIQERAEFEMADTEGDSLTRFHRTRPLHELELEFRSRAAKAYQ